MNRINILESAKKEQTSKSLEKAVETLKPSSSLQELNLLETKTAVNSEINRLIYYRPVQNREKALWL